MSPVVVSLVRAAKDEEKQMEWEKSAENYSKAIKMDPKNPQVYEWRCDDYEKLFIMDKALADMRKAISLQPHVPEFYRHLGHLFFKMKRLDEAAAAYSQSLLMEPEDAGAFRMRGRVYQQLGKTKEAIADFEAFCKARPKDDNNGEIHSVLGELLLTSGNLRRALEVYSDEIKLVPDLPGGYHGRAKVYVRIGRKDLAEKDEKTASEIEKSY